MEELHEQACQQIFQSRNASHPDVLDLHGLHVDEALSILETFLLKQARELVDGPPSQLQSQSQPSRAQHKSAVATATGLYNGSFSSGTTTSSALSSSSGSSGSHAGFKLVYVITGTGHHSQSKKARLQPAVQKFLAERGYASVDTSPDGRGGMLTVTIKP